MPRLAFLVASLVAFAGCERLNPLYCPDEPHSSGPGCIVDPDAQSKPDAPRGPCQVSNDCAGTSNTPVCETKQSPPMCVQCTDDEKAQCTGTTPLCKSNSCAACVTDDECGTGGLCLPDGACAGAANIIHAVSTTGIDDVGCGILGESGACTLDRALLEVTDTKNVIKLDDKGPYTPSTNNFVVNVNVRIDARVFEPDGSYKGGSVLHHKKDGDTLLTINSNNIVTIFGGRIEGAKNADGILCGPNATLTINGTIIDTIEKAAINASSGCKLTVTNAMISHTSLQSGLLVASILAAGDSVTLSRTLLHTNKGGGINVTNGTFMIIGNAFSNNGNATSLLGGVLITTALNSMNRIEFNTLESNHAMSGGKAPGIDCTAGINAIARNNIIWNNNDNVGAQIGGTCQHAYSDIGMTGVEATNDGGHNLSIDPMIVRPKFDLHLQSISPMIGKADPNAKLDGVAAKDLDDDLRVAPADIGQDQLPR